jgi:hypothetical protein
VKIQTAIAANLAGDTRIPITPRGPRRSAAKLGFSCRFVRPPDQSFTTQKLILSFLTS